MSKMNRNLYGMVLLGLASVFAGPAFADNVTRSCDAFYQWETTGGSFDWTFGNFTGKGGCGRNFQNRCRERARDAAMNCMTTHRDIRWERRTPEACLNAAGVYGYHVGIPPCITTSSNQCVSPRHEVPEGDLKTRLEVEVCCALGKPENFKSLRCGKNVHVRVKAVVTGGDSHCRKTRELFDDYVIADCNAIWKNICAQTPQQPAGC